MRDNFLEIFGNDVTRVQAFEVFDRAIHGSQLKLSRRINNADYYPVDASMKAAADAPMRPSLKELV